MNGKFLYVANELPEKGWITAYRVDERTGVLEPVSSVDTSGSAMCHLAVSCDGRFLYAANYGSGNIVCYPVLLDGRVGEMCCNVQLMERGLNLQRQEGPHAHSVIPDLSGNFLIAADLGTDCLKIYRIDRNTGVLVPNSVQPYIRVKDGEGPRYFVFHPNRK